MWLKVAKTILVDTLLMILFMIAITLLFKGPIDLFTLGQYKIKSYAVTILQLIPGILIFFTLLELVST
ncbi:hypothetical protein IWT30_01967 [Secundilactobacillus mixtipabuli]|uniref:Uncharacterized protein n=1 Tax=Secundilactobacillus mixtipabuli TaxID=1435342 RepID=A0A1Z5IEA4_9LACO|nr:hypothetical protein IWT30_01967 [Secundilactobacillus mixtipabuli]